MKLKFGSIEISLKSIFLLSLFILIAVNIFNKTHYCADFEYVAIPLILCMLLSFTQRKHLKDNGYLLIGLMMIFTIISTVISDVTYLKIGHIKFFIFIIAYVFISSVDLDIKDVRSIIKAYIFIAFICAAMIVITYLLGMNLTYQHRATLVVWGVEKDQNYTGAFLAPGAVFSFYKFLYSEKRKRLLSLGICVFILLAVFFTGSRAGLLSCIISLAICLVFIDRSEVSLSRRLLYIAAIIIVAISVYVLLSNSALFERMTDSSGYTDNIRLVIWGYAMEGFFKRPFIGNGLYSATYYSQQHVRWVTHNCFIDILVGQGLIGVIFFVGIFCKYIFVKKGNRIFISNLLIIFLLPYFFLNGYETLSFWLPLILVKIISDCCKDHDYSDLF